MSRPVEACLRRWCARHCFLLQILRRCLFHQRGCLPTVGKCVSPAARNKASVRLTRFAFAFVAPSDAVRHHKCIRMERINKPSKKARTCRKVSSKRGGPGKVAFRSSFNVLIRKAVTPTIANPALPSPCFASALPWLRSCCGSVGDGRSKTYQGEDRGNGRVCVRYSSPAMLAQLHFIELTNNASKPATAGHNPVHHYMHLAITPVPSM
jgi:hypothetical protein